jgi:hypothetical protein
MGEESFSALEPARGAQTDKTSQDDAEVEGGDVGLVALEDVDLASQVEPSHAARLADVSEAPLDGLLTFLEEAFVGAPKTSSNATGEAPDALPYGDIRSS